MAQRDDMEKRLRKQAPGAAHLLREIDRALLGAGYRGAIVTTTEDMTEEEQLMALYEGFIREGYPEEEADRKARQWLDMAGRILESEDDPSP